MTAGLEPETLVYEWFKPVFLRFFDCRIAEFIILKTYKLQKRMKGLQLNYVVRPRNVISKPNLCLYP
jgi:hypothetical protein